MIKTIFWDFDGVILDTMKIKGDGFVELFQNFKSKDVKFLEKYHYQNGGISRFDKIKFFYKQVLKKKISKNEVIKLADKFSNIIEAKLLNETNLIQDSLIFIKDNFRNYDFHIISSAEDKELNNLCKKFKIDGYFKSIKGSPIKKDVLVKCTIKKFNYNKKDILLIGDSINDYEAAKKNNIKFRGYNNVSLKKLGNYIIKFNNIKL